MIGATTHGKGSASRLRGRRLWDENFDQINFPSRPVVRVQPPQPAEEIRLEFIVTNKAQGGRTARSRAPRTGLYGHG